METHSATWPDPSQRATATETLAHLHTRIVDAGAGFDVMVSRAEPEFRPTAEAFRALHARHAETIARHLTDLGVDPDPDGSFMATVNRVVVSVRAVFDEIDADAMESIRRGERHVIDAFDEAMGAELPPVLVTDLRRMHTELDALLDATAHLD